MHTKGYIYALITVTLWSGWAVVTRLGAVQALHPMDLAFLRFGAAGLLMLPIALKNRHYITRKNYKTLAVMICGAGLGYFLFMAFGFKLAPASHGIITPCLLPVIVAIASSKLFHEKFGKLRIFGYALIVIGVAYKMYFSLASGAVTADLLFILGAICWSAYTIQTKIYRHIPPLVTTAFVQVGSMAFIVIPYFIFQGLEPHSLPLMPSLVQVLYQGVVTSIISLLTFNKAVAIIGASKTSSFAALLPVMVIFLSMPILSEYPHVPDIIFASLMTVGVFLASGVLKLKTKQL
jgi:drug/metabolite transporter (DMT)-like permease